MKPGDETLGEASQMLRDILQSNKEKKSKAGDQLGDNNNTLKTFDTVSSTSGINTFCAAADSDSQEMMNSLMRGKASSSKANSVEDNDAHSDNYNNLSGDDSDLDSYNDHINGEEEAHKENDADHNDSAGMADHQGPSDSKEAKRARVENILTTIRQSPQAGFESFAQASYEMKRQKRKQPQPQQHDVKSLLAPDTKYRKLVLQEHIRHLQEQLHAVERTFHQISSQSDSEEEAGEEDKDLTTNHEEIDSEKADSPVGEVRDNFLNVSPRDTDAVITSPFLNRLSPRTHPVREEPGPVTSTPFRFNGKPVAEQFLSISRMIKTSDSYVPQNGTASVPVVPPPPGLQQAALSLKSEIIEAVAEAVDSALSTVLGKHAAVMNKQQRPEPMKPESHSHQPPQPQQIPVQQKQEEKEQQPQEQQEQTQQQQPQQQQQQQQQQQHHPAQHQPLPSPQSHKQPESIPLPLAAPHPRHEREALRETVSNSQIERNSEVIVPPYPDHLNFLERFSHNRLPEKISAFEPLHRSEGSDLIKPHTSTALPFPPHYPYSYMPAGLLPPVFPVEPEQTEALPLVVSNVPKKKRTKVTDTRLSPRAKTALLQDGPLAGLPAMLGEMGGERHHPMLPSHFPHHYLPPVLPTSVAITNPSLHRSDLFNFRFHDSLFDNRLPSPPMLPERGSPKSPGLQDPMHGLLKADAFDTSNHDSMDGQSSQKTCTLTPMHLRKAKLMFFFTRYPNSGILKIYFPDVSFNKNNTAQLVKWFSNFREFYYIQMEKYARQAVADGIMHTEDLVINRDCELFRHLNLHYNRNNQLEAPESFRLVVESTLKEFFRAIYTKKDLESSWKKAIYKVIARMDEPLPEFFKSPNWMEQLGEV